MFILELVYTAPLAAIDARMKAHMAFLQKHCAAGRFLMSGRKIPRDGGIILATATTREDIERIAGEDPFVVHGLAQVRIIEFRVSQRADNLDGRIERPRPAGRSAADRAGDRKGR